MPISRSVKLEPSRECATRALAAARETGQLTAEAEAHNVLGEIAIEEGDLASAENHIEIALETAQRAGNVLSECSGSHSDGLCFCSLQGADDVGRSRRSRGARRADRFCSLSSVGAEYAGQVQYRLGRFDKAAGDLAVSAARGPELDPRVQIEIAPGHSSCWRVTQGPRRSRASPRGLRDGAGPRRERGGPRCMRARSPAWRGSSSATSCPGG